MRVVERYISMGFILFFLLFYQPVSETRLPYYLLYETFVFASHISYKIGFLARKESNEFANGNLVNALIFCGTATTFSLLVPFFQQRCVRLFTAFAGFGIVSSLQKIVGITELDSGNCKFLRCFTSFEHNYKRLKKWTRTRCRYISILLKFF